MQELENLREQHRDESELQRQSIRSISNRIGLSSDVRQSLLRGIRETLRMSGVESAGAIAKIEVMLGFLMMKETTDENGEVVQELREFQPSRNTAFYLPFKARKDAIVKNMKRLLAIRNPDFYGEQFVNNSLGSGWQFLGYVSAVINISSANIAKTPRFAKSFERMST